MSLIRRQLFEFGPFRLDAQEGLLLRDGQPVSVPPKALDLLVALVSRRAIDRSGHLVHAADGALFAAPFDLETLRVTGPDVQVIRPVMMGLPEEMRMAEFAVSHTGILVYLPGPVLQTPRTLVWVNRSGREELLLAEPRWYGWPRFSPDGSRLAFTLCEGLKDSDVWIHDVVRHTRRAG